jgi:hypothetical protein
MAGKFDSDLDAALYEITLDGPDEECGDVSEIGYWAGLLRDGAELARLVSTAKKGFRSYAHITGRGAVPDEELADLRRSAGVIVTEDDQGFVHVAMFRTKAELDKEWANCEHDAEEGYDELESEDVTSGEDDDGYDSDSE